LRALVLVLIFFMAATETLAPFFAPPAASEGATCSALPSIRSVSLIAAEHMQNLHGAAIVIETEPHAPFPDAESVFGRGDVLKPQHVAFGLACKRFHRLPDSILFAAVEMGQFLQPAAPRSLASSRQPEAPHDLIVGDSFPLFDLAPCFGDGRAFLFGLRFVVDRDITQGQRFRTGVQRFEDSQRGGNVLARKRFDEVV
jgi:hypothetical protein